MKMGVPQFLHLTNVLRLGIRSKFKRYLVLQEEHWMTMRKLDPVTCMTYIMVCLMDDARLLRGKVKRLKWGCPEMSNFIRIDGRSRA